ncbi:hypothetical protein GLOIN_2v1779317 [Rhizophagus irregularis DAOM 181602=DAOM 197198]|uniref:Uncharacterized protein n=1 Tax=Rhizophagus irregularis (strain DAOM 181602 / DAOM 197198 / MUCL 43194) TaxID=747089 RepID=A0A2P4PPY4_RHIID|nr:hypothetical protein GLOIN_2v1779317 [Rhizophagus irregularis DAOM 181602=DAOM 197198]POG67464.1 hypothetical protein GLOIN_2v1779317 [Rhizophagus irregularis DAOM 181602=DAOM 197198]|eukprot:XP_025174330.1 hypothetical protein GLOIN_2v1779317 [Rhizophagus irregularis DAOM 181602=DAOM 197198]
MLHKYFGIWDGMGFGIGIWDGMGYGMGGEGMGGDFKWAASRSNKGKCNLCLFIIVSTKAN